MSQMAWTSTVRIFLSTGKCATCAIAPPPMIPTLSRSLAAPPRPAVMTPLSVPATHAGSRKVCGQDLSVSLPCSGSPDRPPLTKSDAVARTHALDGEMGDPAAAPRSGESEGVAAQQLPIRRPQHLPYCRAGHPHLRTSQRNCDLIHPTRCRAPGNPDIPHLPDLLRFDSRHRRQIPLQRRLERLVAPFLVPAIPR